VLATSANLRRFRNGFSLVVDVVVVVVVVVVVSSSSLSTAKRFELGLVDVAGAMGGRLTISFNRIDLVTSNPSSSNSFGESSRRRRIDFGAR